MYTGDNTCALFASTATGVCDHHRPAGDANSLVQGSVAAANPQPHLSSSQSFWGCSAGAHLRRRGFVGSRRKVGLLLLCLGAQWIFFFSSLTELLNNLDAVSWSNSAV